MILRALRIGKGKGHVVAVEVATVVGGVIEAHERKVVVDGEGTAVLARVVHRSKGEVVLSAGQTVLGYADS